MLAVVSPICFRLRLSLESNSSKRIFTCYLSTCCERYWTFSLLSFAIGTVHVAFPPQSMHVPWASIYLSDRSIQRLASLLSLNNYCSGEYHVDALKPRPSMSLPFASSSTSTWIMPQCRSYMHIFISYKLQMWYDDDDDNDDERSRRRFYCRLNQQLRWVRR